MARHTPVIESPDSRNEQESGWQKEGSHGRQQKRTNTEQNERVEVNEWDPSPGRRTDSLD